MNQTYIIAEAGVNHNGSIDMAKKLVDTAAEAGADAIKFQTFRAEKLVNKKAEKAEYQKKTTDANESQFDMIKKLELDQSAHEELINYCQYKGIQFLSTPFDLDSVDLLANRFDLPRIKISSGEITNGPLLLKVALTNKPIILSTGMSTLGEIETALGILAFGYLKCNGANKNPSLESFEEAFFSEKGQMALQKNVILLHCTTEYPASFEEVNLKAMCTLKNAFNLKVGYSDHTAGISVPIAAVVLGAVVIEKHMTLNCSLPGPDHKASLEPGEFKAMVDSIRQVELALGKSIKIPSDSELKNREIARKSLTAAKKIAKGEKYTEENLTMKRPGSGISPIYYWDWLGKESNREYQEDEVIR